MQHVSKCYITHADHLGYIGEDTMPT